MVVSGVVELVVIVVVVVELDSGGHRNSLTCFVELSSFGISGGRSLESIVVKHTRMTERLWTD